MGKENRIRLWGRQRPRRLVWWVGAWTIGYNLFDMCYPYFAQQRREKFNLSQRYGGNSYVVISGATDPLGRQFAQDFISKGFNLVLVDRDQAQLDQLRTELNADQQKVETFTFDFETDGQW
jgi:17beta-estradiol 17-dehydrogenase / very-long-chain 3-oxoacyl-CoA reductase